MIFQLIGAFLRSFLGCILIMAGIGKMLDPDGTRRAVAAYGQFAKQSPWIARLGRMLPLMEIALGATLVCQVLPVVASFTTIVLWLVFLGVVLRVLRRGTSMDCHCFGALTDEPVGAWTVRRLVVLLVLTAVVAGIDVPTMHTTGVILVSPMTVQMRAIVAVVTALAILCLFLLGQVVAMFHVIARPENSRDRALVQSKRWHAEGG